jgi:hypothetical protein
MAQRAHVLEQSCDELIERYERDGPYRISEEDYVRLALYDPRIKWELHGGLLVEKPGMSFTHLDTGAILVHQLAQQLPLSKYRILSNDGRLRRPMRTYLIPDVSVVSSELIRSLRRAQPRGLGVFDEPLPFVAEAWSPGTGHYDVNVKIPIYKQRGDVEIWHIHPYERTVTIWRRQDDGSYDEQTVTSGTIRLHALPDVVIDVEALFDI